jgi:hypothetical protein
MKEDGIYHEIEAAKQQGANLLVPSTNIMGLSEWHAPVIEKVILSPRGCTLIPVKRGRCENYWHCPDQVTCLTIADEHNWTGWRARV